MTVAVPIQVFLITSWVFSAIGGGVLMYHARDKDDSAIFASIVILTFSLILLIIGMS